ncbi:MAG: beta-ketoacyl synthase N-terminal-like domain-containing protein [Bacteroidota bacterium]
MTKIAIIGTSGLFPGSSTNEAFWKNLLDKKDLTSMATEEDFGVDPSIFFQPEKGVVDRCYSLRGGYIRDFKFDPNGYELPADFLANQDKLYQWSLYVAKEALRDSGYLEDKKSRANCGLILGNLSFPTGSSHKLLSSVYTQTTEAALQKVLQDPDFKITPHRYQQPQNEVLKYTPSQMVNEALGLNGSHYALDAACATSLYAIKLACDELVTGKSDLMLAGAVCASDQLFIHMGFSIFHAYAPHGEKFVPMDSNSAGLVSSEGAGMVVLKRLEDAEADNDNILAVIGGIGLSNDGRGKFLLSPHPKGQRLAFERAYAQGDIQAKDTTYLECHATGTPLGDVTELNSISNFFQEKNVKPLLGSVKSNMGHLLTAAGMTGLLKVLLAMQHETIPPNINLEEAVKADNGWIDQSQMITQPTSWTDKNKQAGINSFGFGGTNAHMVVRNYDANSSPSRFLKSGRTQLVPMSIIGMDAHFGDCTNLENFYSTIYHGKQHFKELPKGRWKGFDENAELLKEYGFEDERPPKGAYIEDFEIDLLRYKIQPKEAETLEPQQALILKVADNAIKDAGLDESTNVAVLIAMESELAIHHYLARWDVTWQLKEALRKSNVILTSEEASELEELCKNGIYFREGSQTPSQHTSFVGNIMASRIAALWDFSGAAFTVSCGENSAYKALEIAQNMLSLGEVDAVVVGGVDFSGGLENVLLRNQKEKVNQNNNPSISLNENDNGWLIGEGAGAIVLKKASEVKEEKVYATIDSIGKNLSSKDIGYQEFSISEFDFPSELIGNGETHSLTESQTMRRTAIGSVHANIGNTFAASGIASMIKAALCLHHKFIPAIPNWKAPKDTFTKLSKFSKRKQFYFPSKSRPWILQNNTTQRKAIVNGLENVQVGMSEAISTSNNQKRQFLQKNTPYLFALKGNTEKEIQQQFSALEIALETTTPLAEIAQQFFVKAQNKTNTYCVVLVGKNKKELTQEIQFFQKNISKAFEKSQILKTPRGSYFSPNPLGQKGKVAFVYPGSSTAYTGLGKDLFQLFPQLYPYFEEKLPNLDQYIWSDYLFPKKINTADENPDIYNNAIAMMSTGVFFASAYTYILQEIFQLNPQMAFGYSMGECSSMFYATGVWSAREAQEFQDSPIFKNRFAGNLELLAEHWGISTEEAKERWVSLVLLAPRTKVEALIKGKDKVYLTFINTENEVVISGDKIACLAIVETLGCQFVTIPFQNVIHHDFCKKEEAGLIKMHNFNLVKYPNIDFYSSITNDKIEFDSLAIAKNSTTVCEQKVDFPKTVNTLFENNARIFIEVGANATCTGWIKDILKGKEHLAVSIDQKGKSDAQAIIEMLAQLVSHGVGVDLSALYLQPKEGKAPRSFMKKIEVGGKPIFELIPPALEGEFSPPAPKGELWSASGKVNTEEKKLVTAGHNNIFSKKSSALVFPNTKELENTKTIHLQKNKMDNLTLKNTLEPSTITNKSTNGNSPLGGRGLGENGLRLQDFESGEQLKGKEIIFTQQDLEEFATGKIANVFGPEYAIIDTYRRRTMLPMYPYLLVSRVTGLKGERGKFEPSFMQTEYDIPYNAWFTTDRQIPWAVSVESGQCDLLLIAYLGIDFQNKGNLVYRLLDCTLTFVDDLPFEGQTLRYDISINSFVRNGDNLLFFFSYRCYVQDRLVLKMDGGCAGYFSDEQLEEGNGVVYTDAEIEVRNNAKKRHFTPLLNTQKTSFSKEDLQHLINGDMEKCFDDISYYANGRNPSLRLPPEKILMIDRITSVDLTGGAYGLGYIVAEKDLHPDDWYFPCHFRDDEVLAGSLQAEGGGNLLRFFMLMLGLQKLTKDARYQPVFDLPQKVRCRKQVTPKDTKLIYKLEIKEIGLIPNPYVIGDLEIISDGIVTVHFENLGLQLREKTNPRYLEMENGGQENFYGVQVSPRSEGALLNELDITTFALDDLSKCFGPDFAVYDGRKVSRQPNTDLQVISRIVSVEGTRGDFSKPSKIHAEYDVPVDAWYYEQNSAITMPYSVLMEIALQPCGLLGAYLGSTLQFADKNLYFRNLDGNGQMFDLPSGTDFRGKTITNHALLTSSVALGGTILQNYTFECSIDGHVFYKGKSSFGFFPEEALATQVGLDGGKNIEPWFATNNLQTTDYMQIKLDSLYGRMKLYKAPTNKPHYRLAGNQLNLLDKLIIAKDSGEHGKGYIHATKFNKPYEWFFTCHFYQDPVMPGSLGVEAIMQAMEVFALQQDLGKEFSNPKFVQVPNHETIWKYRGQILTHVEEMQLEVHIKSIEKRDGRLVVIGDASLWNDEVRIYQVTDLALGIEEA